jgi:hypothetical protein
MTHLVIGDGKTVSIGCSTGDVVKAPMLIIELYYFLSFFLFSIPFDSTTTLKKFR